MHAEVIVDNRQDGTELPEGWQTLAEKLVAACLERYAEDGEYEVSVIVVDDREIRRLNREYRGVDSSTDVLSFAMRDGDDETDDVYDGLDFEDEADEDEYVVDEAEDDPDDPEEDQPELLGDIVISAQTARRQATEYGHGFSRELGFLTTHGTLHLLGFDHMSKDDEAKMRTAEEEILRALDLSRE